MRALRVTCIFVAVLLLTACAPSPKLDATVTLGTVEVRVYVADEADEWSRGLQGYDSLAPGEGMLFDFGDSAVRTFAMKEVSFPIDVVFIGEDLTVATIEPLDPHDARVVTSPGPSAYVVELPQGWAAEQGITVGSAFERGRDDRQ